MRNKFEFKQYFLWISKLVLSDEIHWYFPRTGTNSWKNYRYKFLQFVFQLRLKKFLKADIYLNQFQIPPSIKYIT